MLADLFFHLVRLWLGRFFQQHRTGHREQHDPEALAVRVGVGGLQAAHMPYLHAPECDVSKRAYYADDAGRIEGEVVFAGEHVG